MKNKMLTEGLREMDLKNLVIPMLTIDEFESKVDDDAIVIGFYVKDSDPADDLNRFIQKSPVILLDTDVSPAPNEDGYFIVFVEVDRDDQFENKLSTILEEVQNLIGIKNTDWSFTCYGHDAIFELTKENIDILIRTESIEQLKANAQAESIVEFFEPSVLDDLKLVESNLSVRKGRANLSGNILSFGPWDQLSESILDQPVKLSESAIRSCRSWEHALGEGWSVQQLGTNLVISNDSSSNVLIIH